MIEDYLFVPFEVNTIKFSCRGCMGKYQNLQFTFCFYKCFDTILREMAQPQT